MSAGNSVMQLERGTGWTRGLRNLLRAEFADWFTTSSWWAQILIWAAIVNGMLLIVTLTSPDKVDVAETGIMLFNIFLGMGAPVGVAIVMMGAVVDEKRSGTAAWVLSKPVSRAAFLVAKVVANTTGVAVTMVAAQGLIAYLILALLADTALPPLGFVAALGVHLVNLFFFLSLTLMLGALYDSRGPVVGLPIAFNFLQQYLAGLTPALAKVVPWTLFAPLNNSPEPSIAIALMTGSPLPSLMPIVSTLLLSVVFLGVGLWGFQRHEL